MKFPQDMIISKAREVMNTLVWDGHKCPVCDQNAKVYKRNIHSGMVRVLIEMWREGKRDWVYLPNLPQKSRDSAAMAYWGLIEEEKERRKDGGRGGWWRVTALGEAWLTGGATIPKYAHVYAGRCLELLGDPITISDALGKKFNYDELMRGI